MYRGIAILAAVTSLAIATQARAGTAPTIYRLEANSTFEEGCQPPCQCPIITTSDLFGTFTLQFTYADPAGYNHYAVRDVNWEVDMPDSSQRRVTGSGEYKVGGQFGLNHQLQLDLSFDTAAPKHFDSGLVAGGGNFPVIDIAIARNGFYCWDQVFRLTASPVPATALVPYHLEQSQYLEGCLPPCLCPIFSWPAVGTFDLIDLGSSSTVGVQHYALVYIAWHTLPTPAPPERTFTGFGIYRVDASAAKQRLVCDLTDGNGTTKRFDSGNVAGGQYAPGKIDVDIAVNGFYCYDQVFQLHARM
jgi:hypothetical protein